MPPINLINIDTVAMMGAWLALKPLSVSQCHTVCGAIGPGPLHPYRGPGHKPLHRPTFDQ